MPQKKHPQPNYNSSVVALNRSAMLPDHLSECHDCGLLQTNPPLPPGGMTECGRCGGALHRDRPDSLNRTLALTLAGAMLFLVANLLPFLSFEMQGRQTQTALMTGAFDLYADGQWLIAAVVLFTTVIAPGLQLAFLLVVLIPLRFPAFGHGPLPSWLPWIFRWATHLDAWAMMDVFVVGILVSVVKLSEMATIVPGLALFAFALLIPVLAAARAALDPDIIWSRIPLPAGIRRNVRRRDPHLACTICGLVIHRADADRSGEMRRCPRCGEVLHRRKPASLQRTWALLIAAMIFYVPANLLPIMTVTSFGHTQSDTILSGVTFMLEHGMWLLAVVVFIASVFVPLLKLLILMFLLLSVRVRSGWRPRDRTRLYRITELIGRWSMVDVYVVTILVALVHLGNVARIQAEAGAVFFCAVVIVTMLAANAFDARLIWDRLPAARKQAAPPDLYGTANA